MAELAAVAGYAGVPPTPVEPVVDSLHGVVVADPYRWLEGSAAPEAADDGGELDRRVADWTATQNAYTRSVLDTLPGRAALEGRLRELMEIESVTAPQVRGDRHFYWRRARSQAQWTVQVREGTDGPERTLVDPNELDPEGLTSLSWVEPSQDGRRMAFGVFRAGDENTVLHLLEVETGEWLADEIPGKAESVSWMPDGSGFFYRRLADPENPYSGQIRFHRVGRHHRQDPVLYEQHKEGPLATTWGPFAVADRTGRWLVLGYWTGTDANDLAVVDLDAWRRTGKVEPRWIVRGTAARFFGLIEGETLYLRTSLGAPNGRILAVDLADPEPAKWRELVPECGGAVLEGFDLAPGQLVLTYLEDAVNRIERFDLQGRPLGTVALPGLGSASINCEPDSRTAFLTYTSFAQPASVYRVDLASGAVTPWRLPDVPVDPSSIVVQQVKYRSKDGTEVPLFLVHRRGLEADGDRPVLLSGYGGFGVSQTPAFSPTVVPWIEAGGVFALANLRGGGELGEDWHRAGMLAAKQNVFDDFLAAAEWLIAQGWTRPARLAISGGSNGGLLTGAALTQRPELFAAAVSRVPLLDMLRYHHFLMARYWVPEYGSAEDAAQFAYLRAYSPYHNVKDGVRYPAVLLTAAENDARVHPLHARKMAARLQAASASDPEISPVLVYIESQAGHGIGKPLDDRIRESADTAIFLMWQTGLGQEAAPRPRLTSG